MENESKVKCTFTINGMDLYQFKKLTKQQRTTPSIVIGQFIHKYLTTAQKNNSQPKQ